MRKSQIIGLGQRDGSTIEAEVIQTLDGDRKDYVLHKTGQHQVTLFRLTGKDWDAERMVDDVME